MRNPMKKSTKDIINESCNNPTLEDDIKNIDYSEIDVDNIDLYTVEKLSPDIKKIILSKVRVSKDEIKTIVDSFYDMQNRRKMLTEQIRAIKKNNNIITIDEEANLVILNWILKNTIIMEKSIKNVLELICKSDTVGTWLLSTVGIGPVLAAGLLSYFDIEGKQYATQFLSYGGLNDNNRPWLGKEKSKQIVNEVIGDDKEITDEHVLQIAAKTQWRYDYLYDKAFNQDKGKWSKSSIIKACSVIPYNKNLKTMLYNVGESFHWQCNNPKSLYGRLYTERKVLELQRNENGFYAEQAANILKEKNIGEDTEAYKALSQGKLPLAHINARCIRWVEKIFVSHLFEEMYRVHYDKIPPRYYTLSHSDGKHNREILPEVPYTLVTEELENL